MEKSLDSIMLVMKLRYVYEGGGEENKGEMMKDVQGWWECWMKK